MQFKAITFYDLDDVIYDKITSVIRDVCGRTGHLDKEVIFFEIFAEIVQNAAKANFKEVVKREIEMDKKNKPEYEYLMKNFKDRLPKAHKELALKARRYNLFITLEVILSKSKILQLRCINNRPASERELQRLNYKIEQSKKYTKLADFYLDHYDDSEGAGLGTALIDISLRAMGYKNFLYRVFNDGDKKTITELVIDMDEKGVIKYD
jgi:hypothetical protein